MLVSGNRHINKFSKRFDKISRKLLKKLSPLEYLRTFSSFQLIIQECGKNLMVASNDFHNISTRATIVRTLRDIDYHRGNNSWTEKAVIGFLDEVIDLYTYEGNDELIAAEAEAISNRYNVSKCRLKTQVALFINNLYAGKDKYNIYAYFSPYEIVKWKYRDIQKLQDDVESGKLTEQDRVLLQELEII